ncbi:hypothetical protein [Variovorax sp. 22077]|uniref:hypothetical protein n=1 Tax=Variovorax sp. 22077 TaxID=3453867 RepID=UPI003F8369AC
MNTGHEIRRGWARWATRAYRIRYPQYEARLYEYPANFVLYSNIPDDELATMRKIVDEQVRPVTCPLQLINIVPPDALLLQDAQTYDRELWLNDAPLSTPDINRLLGLVDPAIPDGGIDYAFDLDSWVFKSFEPVDDEQRDRVRAAMRTLGVVGEVQFQTADRPAETDLQAAARRILPDLSLATSRQQTHLDSAVRHLLAQDEDEWRTFLRQRGAHVPLQTLLEDERADCLFDASDKSDVRLSELLTLYERVSLIPDPSDPLWLKRHGIELADLQELVMAGRCRLILPFSITRYEPKLLAAVAEVDHDALVLSRSLARRVIIAGQSKDPLLYGPFTVSQRSAILSLLHEMTRASGDAHNISGKSYSAILRGQHQAFMMQGAAACLNGGIGAYLGELIFLLKDQDARLELGTAGAAVEWALGLGAALIPRSFAGGYDETGNCHTVASFMSRTRSRPMDPVAQRMHTLTDGLLALADVPVMEVARNFKGESARRFRTVAARLMKEATTQAAMQEVVAQINVETQKFERRRERLKKWKLDTISAGITGKLVGDAIDEGFGNWASVGASILYAYLSAYAPQRLKDSCDEIATIMRGLVLAPSLDAVIVSRCRAQLPSK